tara:strand:- start:1960 stop:2322 length:363 start_codon:yes stop_codon:yes gene_type:complete
MADVNLTLDFRMEVVETTSHRVRTYGFGDGYEAMSPDGVNSRMTEYSVVTEPIVGAATQTSFQRDLDKVAVGDYFLATLQPWSNEQRRYRLKDNTYSRKINPVIGAIEYTFTLVEAYANA